MDESNIELLARMGVESGDWDRPDAADSRTAACPSMTRLASVCAHGAAMSADERVHLASCHLCAGRYRALRDTSAVEARRGAGRRWMGGISAVAACLLVWALLTPRPVGPHAPALVPARAVAASGVVCILGDSNCDGITDASDLSAFALALHHPEAYATQYPQCDLVCSNDLNGDCEVDDGDLAQMVQCTGG